MSLVSALAGRVLTSLAVYARGALARAGAGPVLAAAIAAAALFYSWRQHSRKTNNNNNNNNNSNGDQRRRASSRSHSGSTRTRRRDQQRSKAFPAVRRLTIGAEVGSENSIFFNKSLEERTEEPIENSSPQAKNDTAEESDVIDDTAKLLVNNVEENVNSAASSDEVEPIVDADAQPERSSRTVVTISAKMSEDLQRFSQLFDMYIIARVDSDGEELAVMEALRNAKVFEAGMDERKVVFCDTTAGRVSVVRQLEPQMHIDETASVITNLQRFVRHVTWISSDSGSSDAPQGDNVLRITSLEALF